MSFGVDRARWARRASPSARSCSRTRRRCRRPSSPCSEIERVERHVRRFLDVALFPVEPVGALIAHDAGVAAAADRMARRATAQRRHALTRTSAATATRAQPVAFQRLIHRHRISTNDRTTLTPSRLWKRMTSEQRLRAGPAFWLDEQATDDQIQAVLLISQQKKFRPKTVVVARRRPQGAASRQPRVAARSDRGARAGRLSPGRAAADDGRVSRRARHRARERPDSGRRCEAGSGENRRQPRRSSRRNSRPRTCRCI